MEPSKSDVLTMLGQLLSGRLSNPTLEAKLARGELADLVDLASAAVEAVDAKFIIVPRTRLGGRA